MTRVTRPRAPGRRHSRLLLVVCAVLLSAATGWGGVSAVHGQGAHVVGGAFTGSEAEALDLYRGEQLVSARSKAEEVLQQSPDSFVGHFVLGSVLHEGEGSLARAMFHLGRARELYETGWQGTSATSPKSELHRELLFKVQALAGELELHEYRLHVLGYHDYLYDPDLLSEQAWALIPLGRFDEAREVASRATKSRDDFEQSSGLNALCAIEGEAGKRASYRSACEDALKHAEERAASASSAASAPDDPAGSEIPVQGGLAVHAYNAALAALTNFDFQGAEELALRGTHRLETTPANPWRLLTRLYLDQGKPTEAVEALREMNRWRRRQPAYLRDQARAETDVALATVLLVTGNTERGLSLVERAIGEPDRRGLTSSSREQALGAHSLLHRAYLLQTRAEQEESACFSGFLSCLGHRLLDFFWGTSDTFLDEERIRATLENPTRLGRTFRAYAKGGLEPLPSWLRHDLIEVLGPGVALAAIQSARMEEQAVTRDAQGEAYLDALEAEVCVATGDWERTRQLVKTALARLPEDEALLRARLSALNAQASMRLGLERDAVASLREVLDADGGILRRLDLPLPARVSGDPKGPWASVASAAKGMLNRSPRFQSGAGFVVHVSSGDDQVRICLLSATGQQIRCSSVQPEQLNESYQEALTQFEEAHRAWLESGEGPEPEAPTKQDPARTLAERFHRDLFSAPVTLSSSDLRSLDGRVVTGAEVAREQMRDLLDQAMSPPP